MNQNLHDMEWDFPILIILHYVTGAEMSRAPDLNIGEGMLELDFTSLRESLNIQEVHVNQAFKPDEECDNTKDHPGVGRLYYHRILCDVCSFDIPCIQK